MTEMSQIMTNIYTYEIFWEKMLTILTKIVEMLTKFCDILNKMLEIVTKLLEIVTKMFKNFDQKVLHLVQNVRDFGKNDPEFD